MAARLIGLVLGLLIAAAGWMVVRPLVGNIGPAVPGLDLADFESLRPLIGWGALGLGGLAVLVNLWPGGRKRRRPLPSGMDQPITFTADPPAGVAVRHNAPDLKLNLAPMAPGPSPFPITAASPTPMAEPVRARPVDVVVSAELARRALPPVAPGPDPSGPPQETFGQLRAALKSRVREEKWGEAGEMLKRLPALALTHNDRMVGAQDLGDFARSQGRIDDAADAYGHALSYARLLHEIEPADPVAASDLAGALINVGDMATDEGRLDAALGAYEDAVALRRKLIANHGARRLDRRALSIALERLADAREDRGHRVRALDLYRESVELAGALAAEDPQRYGAELQGTRTRLAELEARLSV
ncbi:MAG: Tetratricopeptide 2 repeat protein [Caulobacter sp.]|nr:Tetratricopeptide 2 repeat protein [Caulobacter sp.]